MAPVQVRVVHHRPIAAGFSYYEYKYLVPQPQLAQVREILDELLGGSDPFAQGIVDSIYYDTPNEVMYAECLNGEPNKCKFRIRGYGDGTYIQLHQKFKELSSVRKHKAPIVPIDAPREHYPAWEELMPTPAGPGAFDTIVLNSRRYGPLVPSVRIRYHRFRYRAYDYRMTLDTNIEAFAPSNGLPRLTSHASFDNHVLEIKTREDRPKLPLVGLVKLPQISFSKFMIGVNLLRG